MVSMMVLAILSDYNCGAPSSSCFVSADRAVVGGMPLKHGKENGLYGDDHYDVFKFKQGRSKSTDAYAVDAAAAAANAANMRHRSKSRYHPLRSSDNMYRADGVVKTAVHDVDSLSASASYLQRRKHAAKEEALVEDQEHASQHNAGRWRFLFAASHGGRVCQTISRVKYHL